MKHVQVSDSKVVVPSQLYFEISFKDYSFALLASNMMSALKVFYFYFRAFPDSICEVLYPTTNYLLLVCDNSFFGKKSTSICRVPLSENSVVNDIVNYFKFNISDSVNVVFE